jgi:hypothetical protein
MRVVYFTIVFVALTAAGCRHGSLPREHSVPGPATIAGCYRVEEGPWSSVLRSPTITPPPFFRLDTTMIDVLGYSSRRVEPEKVLGVRETVIPAHWGYVPPDSVYIRWSTGFVGVALKMRYQADALQGIAWTLSDIIGASSDTALIEAKRIQCEIAEA